MDEHVLIQGIELGGILYQKLHVLIQLLHLVEDHSAADAALDGIALVKGEVDAAQVPEKNKNSLQALLALGLEVGRLQRLNLG